MGKDVIDKGTERRVEGSESDSSDNSEKMLSDKTDKGVRGKREIGDDISSKAGEVVNLGLQDNINKVVGGASSSTMNNDDKIVSGTESVGGGLKEKRVRAITSLYYSRPDIVKVIFEFGKGREVVPRYFEGFGKRPDNFQYESDVMGLVKKGATSFHCSEEIWENALELDSDMSVEEMGKLRRGWDLLIDIDSPFLDCSKVATRLLIVALEQHGIKNYNVKFSVTGDTPILIKNESSGEIKLSPIKKVIKELKEGNKLKVLSLDKKNKLVCSKIYDYLEHKEEVYEIVHEQSRLPLKATKHHSVFVFDKGRVIEKKVSEINKEDFLVTFNSESNPLISKNDKVTNCFQFGTNQYLKKEIKKDVKLDKGLMRLIGYYLAEGHVTNVINQVGFSFNKNEKKYIEDCVNLLERITKQRISTRHPNTGSTQILIHSKEWASFFEDFCGKKKEKHIPSFSWGLSKGLFLEMLTGYIRGDGYKIGEYGVVVKSVALQLIREFVWLCKLHGISCSLSYEKNKPHKLPQGNEFKGSFVYILKIPKSELIMNEFSRLRNKFSPHPRDRTFPINGLREVYHQIKPKKFIKHRVEQMTLKKERANLDRIKRVIKWFNAFNSEKFSNESKKIIKNYEKLFNSDMGVIKIKSIKKKRRKEKVYDVSVKDTESFFGNSYPVLLHNSGSKGFHIIVPWKAFPEEVGGAQTRLMFPEWARAICSYLMDYIRRDYNKEVGKVVGKINGGEKEVYCTASNRVAHKGNLVSMKCDTCGAEVERRDYKISKRRLKCFNDTCPGILQVAGERNYYYCDYARDPENDKLPLSSDKYPEFFEEVEGVSGEKIANLDLVLVAPRHLFRMPYSLHEKTALASVVLDKNEIERFEPRNANPMNVKVKDFVKKCEAGEGKRLLREALNWYKDRKGKDEDMEKKRFSGKEFKPIDIGEVSENDFPKPIKILLKGLEDGRKRGLFVLITFLRNINYSAEKISEIVYVWNKKNKPPLKEGYIRSQLSWNFKQKKKILPPNYNNESFYRDIGLIDKKQDTKNPLVDVLKRVRKRG